MFQHRQYSSMIRPHASLKGLEDEEDLRNDVDEMVDTLNTTSMDGLLGKRKSIPEYQDERTVLALSKLESLDLDSDEEDDDELLLCNADVEELLAEEDETGYSEVSLPPEPEKTEETKNGSLLPIVRHVRVDNSRTCTLSKESNQRFCPMKWLRTVGMDHTGKLKIDVSADNNSESGFSGKTESLMADTIKGMIDVYLKRRKEVVDRDGVIHTPLHIVKKMIEDDETSIIPLHCEAFAFPNGYHRVELYAEKIRGVGEGVTKKIAAQMAAIDIIEHVRLSTRTVKVPPAVFLPGWLTSNRVFSDLKAYCKKHSLPNPKIRSSINVGKDGVIDDSRPKFRAQCWVGKEMVTIGESETDIFARREAAKEMIFLITGEEYRDTPYAIGRACRRADELAAAGYQLIMSDFKKMWLLENRVKNNALVIPEDEAGIDDSFDLEEVEKEICNKEKLLLQVKEKKHSAKKVKKEEPKRDCVIIRRITF